MVKETSRPHVYRDIIVQNYDPHLLNNDNDIQIGERGIGIVSGKVEKYRERVFGKEGIYLELTCFQDGCSGAIQIQHRPRKQTWEISTYLRGKDIFYAKYRLDGKIRFAVVNTESPGAPLTQSLDHPSEPYDGTRLQLICESDSEGYLSYRPVFHTKQNTWDEVAIQQAAWFRDSAVQVEHEGRVLSIDWTHPSYIEVKAALANGITKYGRFPKQLDPSDIKVFSGHLDEVLFPIQKFSWQFWWGNILAGRDGFR